MDPRQQKGLGLAVREDHYNALVVRTVFEYTPEAVERILRRYKNEKCDGRTRVECWFEPAQQIFQLWGDSVSCEASFDHLMDIISSEVGNDIERRARKEPPLVPRAGLSMLNSTAIQWTEDFSDAEDGPKVDRTSGRISSNHPMFIEHPESADDTATYCFVKYWESNLSVAEFSNMLDPAAGRNFCKKISTACRCSLRPEWETRRIKIGANTRDSLSRVIGKLDRVLELFNRGFQSICLVLVHSAGKRKFEIKLVSFDKQPELNRTTLFPRGAKWPRIGIERMFLIRMAEYDPEKAKFVNCKIESNALRAYYEVGSARGQARWDRTFKAYGTPEGSVIVGSQSPLLGRISMGNLPTVASVTEALARNPERGNNIARQANAPVFSFDSHFGGDEPVFETDEGLGSAHGGGGRPVTMTIRRPRPRVKQEVAKSGDKSPPAEARAFDPNMDEDDLIDLGPRVDVGAQFDTSGPDVEDRLFDEHFSSSFDDSGGGASVARTTSEVEAPPVGPGAAIRTVRRPRVKERALVGNGAAVAETQAPDEKRTLRQTMGQQAPARRNTNDSHDDSRRLGKHNTEKLYDIFTRSFDHIRPWQGHIKFEACLGRIVLTDAPKTAKRGIEWPEWEKTLAQSPDTQKYFTNLLTRELYDAEFILDLKFNRTEVMFSKDLRKDTAFYEFHCTYNNKSRVFVMDADTFDISCYSDVVIFGTVLWAHPARAWDARIRLGGCKRLEWDDEVFANFISSITVRGGVSIPELCFSVTDKDFSVNKVLYRRELRYRVHESVCFGEEIDLAITEAQDLVIQGHLYTPGRFVATGNLRREMVPAKRIFYGFSFIPVKTENFFKENLDLEIGEDVSWTTEEAIGNPVVDGGILKSLINVVNTVITKIDDVGFDNNLE